MTTDADALAVLDPIIAETNEQIPQDAGGLMTMLIGPRGGGKTTAGVWLVQDSKQNYPTVPRISNVPIENATYAPDVLRLLATKLIVEGQSKSYELNPDGTVHVIPVEKQPVKMLVILDEAAISGFEARGSGRFSLDSYLLALSRKLNIDLFLISQLMSMVEKRGQWLTDYYWLCESSRYYGVLDGFHYQVYDESFHKTNAYSLDVSFCKQYLFGKFNTNDIPNYDKLAADFETAYDINEEDIQAYLDVAAMKPHAIPSAPKQIEELFLSKKALRPPYGRYIGETVTKDGKRYQITQRDWDFDEGQYRYRALEIPSLNIFPSEGEPLSENSVVEEGDV